jgi:hypothetical protein
MTDLLARSTRRLAPWLLALGLLVGPAVTPSVRAQVPDDAAAAGGEGEKGRPLDGYLGTLCLVMLAFFIVGKSARR